MFTVALFTITRTWKQPRRPSTDERIKKLWYIYRIEYCSSIKRNKTESAVTKCINIESAIQNELVHIHGI